MLAADQRWTSVGGQGGLPGCVKAAEGDMGGAEVPAEEGDGRLRSEGHIEVDGDELGSEAGEVGAQTLADGDFVTPEHGGRNAGGRRDVTAADGKHAAGEAGGVPVRHSEQAARFEDTGELGGNQGGMGSEHGAEHGDDGVEGGVGVGEIFGVALVKGDLQGFGGGTFTCLDEEVGGDVDAGDDGSTARQRDGDIAGAASDVKHAGAGGDVEAAGEGFGTACDGAGDHPEVSGHPCGAKTGFELFYGGRGRSHGFIPEGPGLERVAAGGAECMLRGGEDVLCAMQPGYRAPPSCFAEYGTGLDGPATTAEDQVEDDQKDDEAETAAAVVADARTHVITAAAEEKQEDDENKD